MLKALLLASTMLIWAAPAKADPVSISFALFQLGAPLGLVNAVAGIGIAGAVVSAIGQLAFAASVAYAVSLLNRPKTPKPSDGQQEVRQAVPARFFHYGRVKVSGPLFFYETRARYLYKGIILSHGEIDGIEQLYLNDKPVATDGSGLNGSGQVTSAPYVNVPSPTVWASWQYGAAGQTSDPVLNANFGEWTTDHRLRGIAYVVAQFRSPDAENFQVAFPNGEPRVAVRLRGKKLYDPRTGLTTYSDNAALAVLDYLISEDGYNRPLGKIDLASFEAMANICDESVPQLAGGTSPRYRIATTINLTERRKDVLHRLLETCDATLYPTSDGKIAIRGGQWEEPAVTLDAGQGHIIEAQFGQVDALQRYNELSVQYMEPALDFIETEAEPWQDVDDIAATGIIETRPFELFHVPNLSQARRLAKLRMERDNPEWTAEIRTNLYGLNAIGERSVRVVWPELEIDGPFWIESAPELLDDMTGVRIRLRSAKSASYDWTAAEEGESVPVPPDTSPNQSFDPPDFTLTQISGPAIRADWTRQGSRTYEAEYREDGSATWIAMTVAATWDSAESGVVVPGIFWVRVRGEYDGAFTDWSAEQSITIT